MLSLHMGEKPAKQGDRSKGFAELDHRYFDKSDAPLVPQLSDPPDPHLVKIDAPRATLIFVPVRNIRYRVNESGASEFL